MLPCKGARMLYRFYRIGTDGRLDGVPDVVECADDDDAIEKATERSIAHGIEIWDLGRRVATIPKRQDSGSGFC
jgi:hypothetical protein